MYVHIINNSTGKLQASDHKTLNYANEYPRLWLGTSLRCDGFESVNGTPKLPDN